MGEAKSPSFKVALVAGGAAGTAVDVALFPIDTIKTRLQAPEGFLKAGGFKGVYNGLASAAAGSAPGAALFFSTYETVKKKLMEGTEERYHPMCYMGASSLGEIAACMVRVPTENVKQKMQAGHFATNGEALSSIWKAKGVLGFYQGYLMTVFREIPFVLIQFPLYEGMKTRWARYQGHASTPIQSALCGSVAGGIAAAATTPLDVVKTRLMLGKDSQGVAYTGIVNTFSRVYAEGGVRRLFAGVEPRTMWISIGGCVFFGAYETSKEMLEKLLD